MEYYKKVDKSFFKYGITITKKYESLFLMGQAIKLGTSRPVVLKWGNKKYNAKISYVNIKNKKPVYQLRWDNSPELQTALKQEFIQSYIAIVSQNFVAKSKDKYYVTKLTGGNQEVMTFEPLSINEIKISTFIKVETPYAELFNKLIDENVFGWLSKENHKQMITKYTKWFDSDKLSEHEDVPYVVYYLQDEINKQLYIGSAKRLGDRVKLNRQEIPNWNKFRYEIIHPKFHYQIKEIEYHSIMNFARFFKNNGNLSNINISDYTLVNKDYKYYLK